MTKDYYNTAYLASALSMSQVQIQRLIREGLIEAPAVRLHGIGVRPPQAGYTENQIQRLKDKRRQFGSAWTKVKHGKST